MRHRRYQSILATILTAVIAPCVLYAGEGKIRRSPHAVKDEYIVVLNDNVAREDVPALAGFLARQHGGALKRVWKDALKGFFVRMTEAQAQGLSHDPDVKYIEENAEMFPSSTVPTNVDPACDPAPGVSCTTTDNRLWHLDVLDQNAAIGTNDYSYCETGSGVYVYVVDTGVMRAHREFNNDATKVLNGYDATGDPPQFPAYDPCGGPGLPNQPPDGQVNPKAIREGSSHGTGVASLINGRNLGVARDAKVVPIKVAPCAQFGVRQLNPNTPNTFYGLGEVVFANSSYYKVKVGGSTGPAGTYPFTNWPWPPQGTPACCQVWGQVQLEYLGNEGIPTQMTVQMTIEGLDWILRPVSQGGNPYPKSPAVVTLSTYRLVGEDGVTNVPTGSTLSLEDAIANLLKYNNGKGITVIASANNQDANACDTSPGRMSRGNPLNPNDPNHPYKVITAGGTMLRNNPDANPARGGFNVDLAEPPYDSTQATRLARWRCWAGDSDDCSANIYSNPAPITPDPNDPNQRNAYVGWTLGSNGGRCVTLFAPAKNIPVANLDDFNGYRGSRQSGGIASGTSWSAPIVAALAARLLESNNALTVDDVYTALINRTTPDLDPVELNPPNVTCPNDGQPCTTNKVLRLTPVVVQPLPLKTTAASSGNTLITVNASGPAGLTYELYQVNASFDVTKYNTGAASAVKISGPQSSNLFSVPSTNGVSYFARVRSACGTGDTNITTITVVNCAPVISSQPQGTLIRAGQTASLSVGATPVSNETLSYQWYVGARGDVTQPASGATSSTFTTPALSATTSYWVRVTASCGAFTDSAAAVVTVQPAQPRDAQVLSQSVPITMAAGGVYPVSITLKNVGTLTWSPIGPQCNAYRLGSANPYNNGTWLSATRVELPAPVAPGDLVTLNFNVTAPAAPGTYNFQWQMVQECLTWFGDLTPNVSVVVTRVPVTLWVSVNGNDTNNCNRATPCRTFSGALAKSSAGDKITVLDTGDFGPVTIDKSIVIANDGAGTAGVQVSDTNGITINAGINDVVILRGLDIGGLGTGLSGIKVLSAGMVRVEGCTIHNFTARGIDFAPASATTTTSQLQISDTIIRDNKGAASGGILIKPGANVAATGTIENTQLRNNLFGLRVEDNSKVTAKNTTAAGNSNSGFVAFSGATAATLNLDSCVATENGWGIRADNPNATVQIANCTIAGNNNGLTTSGGGNIASFGSNNNADSGTPTRNAAQQ